MELIKASIITIGDELLIGQVVDTNSSYIARKLNEIGILVQRRIAIGDRLEEIHKCLHQEAQDNQIIMITGGLGPTKDDKTKDALCRYFDTKLVVNEAALQNVKDLFEKIYQKPVTSVNLAQAEVPEACEVIQNKRGSAPGMLFTQNGVTFISMPGVPYEMFGILEDALPILQSRFQLPVIIHKTILTAGIGESALAELIADFENKLPPDISLAYLPNYGMVRLRLSTSGFDREGTSSKMMAYFQELKSRVSKFSVTDEDEPMQVVLGKLLQSHGKTIATAESCTGGAIASLITSVPGSSGWFAGSVVSYSNQIKEEILHVSKQTIEKFGAVSEETVREMHSGVLDAMKTDYAIAVSGIMGPGGGSADKPVGTVWVAFGDKNRCVTRLLKMRFDRAKSIEVTAVTTLNIMRQFIIDTL